MKVNAFEANLSYQHIDESFDLDPLENVWDHKNAIEVRNLLHGDIKFRS